MVSQAARAFLPPADPGTKFYPLTLGTADRPAQCGRVDDPRLPRSPRRIESPGLAVAGLLRSLSPGALGNGAVPYDGTEPFPAE